MVVAARRVMIQAWDVDPRDPWPDGRMAEIARKTKRYPSDLTDAEWARLVPMIPKPSRRGRNPTINLREMLNAIRYMARSAGGRRMLPTDFGP